jgi:opacity protein-like surface antigen
MRFEEDKKMRKRAFVSVLIVSLMLLCQCLHAQRQSLSFHAHMGMASPAKKNIHSSLASGFGIAYPFTDTLAVVLDFEFWRSSVDVDPDDFYNGEISMTPFLVSMQNSLTSGGRIHPYVLIGTGYVFSSFKIGDVITIPEVTISQKVKSGMCFQAGAGTMFKITKSVALTVEGFFLFRKATGTTTINDLNFGLSTSDFSVDLSTLMLHIGIKYFPQ